VLFDTPEQPYYVLTGHWHPTGKAYSPDPKTMRHRNPAVGDLDDGWPLRQSTYAKRPASSERSTGRTQHAAARASSPISSEPTERRESVGMYSCNWARSDPK